jgi:hypothetical protein
MLRTDDYFSRLAGGIAVRDWIDDALADPDNVKDEVDEGTLVADVPGVKPFPCSLGLP